MSRRNVKNRLSAAIKIGGIKLVFYKLLDRVTHMEMSTELYYNISRRANPNDYPRLLELTYCMKTGNMMDICNPVTFNEKIQWLKLYDSTALKTQLADKYLVREYVKNKVGDQYLIPLLGVWDKFDDINFDELPNSFVLKANHGSGWNIVVKDKSKLDITEAKKKFDKWMKLNFAFRVGFEMHYKDIEPKIIAEKYLTESGSESLTEINILNDYKIHCFNGVPVFFQVIGDRNMKLHTAYQSNYSPNWNKMNWVFEDYPTYNKLIQKPENLDEMIEIATNLSQGFRYVRVDLYETNGKVYFGEMTFTPNSGLYRYRKTFTHEKDCELGDLISLK